jgi:hypothetical protein
MIIILDGNREGFRFESCFSSAGAIGNAPRPILVEWKLVDLSDFVFTGGTMLDRFLDEVLEHLRSLSTPEDFKQAPGFPLSQE